MIVLAGKLAAVVKRPRPCKIKFTPPVSSYMDIVTSLHVAPEEKKEAFFYLLLKLCASVNQLIMMSQREVKTIYISTRFMPADAERRYRKHDLKFEDFGWMMPTKG